MIFLIRMATALCLIGWCNFVYAEDYYWTSGYHVGTKFPSAQAACQAIKNDFTNADSVTAVLTAPSNAKCRLVTNGNIYDGIEVIRAGSGCTLPSVLNPSTGSCEAPEPDECEAKKDQSTTFTKSGRAPDSYAIVLPQGLLGPNQSACFSSCVVSTADQKCKVNKAGQYTCQGVAYYTGQKCTTGPEVDFTDSPKEPEPETITKDKPCQYIEQADGTLRCDSEKSTEKEGQHCGEVNGVKKCVDTKPTKNGIDIKTEVKTETKPDGSTTTTKTDTATHTTCSGINSCTSTTTTTTTTTEKDANGKTNSISGTCTGAACPDKNTNPDGDGDGFGDCATGDCSESGGGPLGSPELEEVSGFGESTDDFVNRVGASPIFTAIDGISLNGSGSCSMSSATTSIGKISADSFCDNSHWLDPLYYIFLAIHALAAVRVFLSA